MPPSVVTKFWVCAPADLSLTKSGILVASFYFSEEQASHNKLTIMTLTKSNSNILRNSLNSPIKSRPEGKGNKSSKTKVSKICSSCHETKSKNEAFSSSQVQKGKRAICMDCEAKRKASISMLRTCRSCNEDKPKTAFSNKQWKKHGNCTSCCEQKQTNDEEKESLRKVYSQTYGNGYEPFSRSSFAEIVEKDVSQEGIENLDGEFEIIFYKSSNNSTEDISRTARGAAHISKQSWKGRSCIHGEYYLDTSPVTSDPVDANLSYLWGEETQGRFIEIPEHRNLSDVRGTDTFGMKGSVIMIADRGGHDSRWWDRSFFQNGRFEETNGFCRMKIGIVQNTVEFAPYEDKLNDLPRLQSIDRSYPPFGLVPQDVVIEIQETLNPDWTKYIILKKKSE